MQKSKITPERTNIKRIDIKHIKDRAKLLFGLVNQGELFKSQGISISRDEAQLLTERATEEKKKGRYLRYNTSEKKFIFSQQRSGDREHNIVLNILHKDYFIPQSYNKHNGINAAENIIKKYPKAKVENKEKQSKISIRHIADRRKLLLDLVNQGEWFKLKGISISRNEAQLLTERAKEEKAKKQYLQYSTSDQKFVFSQQRNSGGTHIVLNTLQTDYFIPHSYNKYNGINAAENIIKKYPKTKVKNNTIAGNRNSFKKIDKNNKKNSSKKRIKHIEDRAKLLFDLVNQGEWFKSQGISISRDEAQLLTERATEEKKKGRYLKYNTQAKSESRKFVFLTNSSGLNNQYRPNYILLNTLREDYFISQSYNEYNGINAAENIIEKYQKAKMKNNTDKSGEIKTTEINYKNFEETKEGPKKRQLCNTQLKANNFSSHYSCPEMSHFQTMSNITQPHYYHSNSVQQLESEALNFNHSDRSLNENWGYINQDHSGTSDSQITSKSVQLPSCDAEYMIPNMEELPSKLDFDHSDRSLNENRGHTNQGYPDMSNAQTTENSGHLHYYPSSNAEDMLPNMEELPSKLDFDHFDRSLNENRGHTNQGYPDMSNAQTTSNNNQLSYHNNVPSTLLGDVYCQQLEELNCSFS